eukprot:m.77231 g.77231  ORF g.77231 m.77231 type:complete len:116 (-) comp14056_c0_seq22:167-514(-)
MIQKYMPTIRTKGETSMIWLDGRISHVIHKPAIFEGDQVHFPKTSEKATQEQVAFVDNVLRNITTPFLYARVDVLFDEDDQMRLSELEMTEPYLYLTSSPEALASYAASLAQLCV